MDNTERATTASGLVDFLLGGKTCFEQAAATIGADGDWPAALALAARWHVLPTFARRLAATDAAGVFLEPRTASSLRAQIAIGALRSAAAVPQAAGVLGELAAASVCAVAIKGVGAMATLYGNAAGRMVSDIDLVIRPRDLALARSTLAERGYVDRSPPFERHVSDIALSATLHNFARTFVRDGFEIDLHWQFGPRPPAALAADRIVGRAIRATVEGYPLCVAGPVEAALLITHHALRGGFHASTTIKDLIDLGLWWEVYGSAWGDELGAAADESGLASSLLVLTRTLVARDPAHPGRAGLALLERRLKRADIAQARRLQAFLDDVVRGDAPDHATVALFAPKVYARSLWGPLCRDIAWNVRGVAPPSAELTTLRKPLTVRVLRRLARGWRIGRELARLGRIVRYRAVAQAQSRFH